MYGRLMNKTDNLAKCPDVNTSEKVFIYNGEEVVSACLRMLLLLCLVHPHPPYLMSSGLEWCLSSSLVWRMRKRTNVSSTINKPAK